MNTAFQNLDEAKTQPLKISEQLISLIDKTTYILEGIINILTLVDSLAKNQVKLEQQLTAIQKAIIDNHHDIKDMKIISHNTNVDIEDLHNVLLDISNKLDGIDNDIRNIKVFKYISKSEI